MITKFYLTRIPLVLIAAVLGWFLASRPGSAGEPFAPRADAPTPSAGSVAEPPPPPSNDMKPQTPGQAAVAPAPQAPPPCTLPKAPVIPAFAWPDPIVPTDPPNLLPINQELASHLANVPTEGEIPIEKVEDAHAAGKIYFMRALYLQTRITAGSVAAIDPAAGFEAPKTVPEAEAKVNEFLGKATFFLTKVRPHPPYRFWSEALYLNAWALSLLGRLPEAVDFLQIAGRTRSQTLYANYARFSLVWYYLREGKGPLAAHWLALLGKVEPQHESLLAVARLRTAVIGKRPELVDAATLAYLSSLTADDPLLLPLLEQAAALCVLESFDRACIQDHLRRLDGPKKTSYLGFLAAKIADNPGMQENLCALIKEGSP
ncbi:hypothetical protein KJ975_06795 [Myxococcota bacterium]|nr:hypothetical protein [Myxococcota bacterium]